MSNHGLGTVASANVQKRSMVEALHELQRQIQAYGPGPFAPDQAKELENLKILYIKAKQQYDKQIKLLQASSMASQQAPTEVSIATGTTLPISSAQAIGITSVPNSQQLIKGQQANIIHQLQNSSTLSSQSTMNAQVLSQQALHLVGSVSSLSASSLPIVSAQNESAAKNPNLHAMSGKQQVAARPQTPVRPTLSTMAAHTVAPGASSLSAQQQLRMIGIMPNLRPEANSGTQLATTVKQQTGIVNSHHAVQVINRRKLQDLLHEIDPRETMDEDVEEVLLQMADDFIENVVGSACKLAKHRKSNTLEIKDIQIHLDRHWNMWVPGFGNEDLRPHKKVAMADAHRQRLAIIKKSMKK